MSGAEAKIVAFKYMPSIKEFPDRKESRNRQPEALWSRCHFQKTIFSALQAHRIPESCIPAQIYGGKRALRRENRTHIQAYSAGLSSQQALQNRFCGVLLHRKQLWRALRRRKKCKRCNCLVWNRTYSQSSD